jgi:hypothetical protein
MKRLYTSVPALVISAAALLVTLTGLATAGTTAGVTPAQVRAIAKSVANAQITARAPSLSVASARSAGAPALYAQVTGTGVITANAAGITQANIVHSRTGVYCFVGLRTAPKGGVAVLDALPPGASGPDQAQVGVGTFGACPAGTQAVVGTFKSDGGVLVDDPFFVVLWS